MVNNVMTKQHELNFLIGAIFVAAAFLITSTPSTAVVHGAQMTGIPSSSLMIHHSLQA
jgi:hypothetical protein